MKIIKSIAVAFSMYSKIPMPKFAWGGEDMKYLPGCSGRKIRGYHNMDVRLDLEDFYAKLMINYPN